MSIRIQALANLVDIDGNGSIDPVEASIFLKACHSVDKLAGHESLKAFSAGIAIPRAELIKVLTSLFSGDDDAALGDLERSFEMLCCDLPPIPKKVSVVNVQEKINALVGKIDLDGNGLIDRYELYSFLSGFARLLTNTRLDPALEVFKKELDPENMAAEMTENGDIPIADFVPRFLASQGIVEGMDAIDVRFYNLLEQAVYSGLDEAAQPTPAKIEARIAKLLNAIDANGDGVLQDSEYDAFAAAFLQHLIDRCLDYEPQDVDECLAWMRSGNKTIACLKKAIIEMTESHGDTLLCELEMAIAEGMEAVATVRNGDRI